MTITLKAMSYFTTAVRLGNIAKAAEVLNIAPSAVATAIDQVEAAFDLTLVTRQRSRGIQANASGRLVAQKLERLLEDYRATLAEGADLKQSLSGALRIGYYAPIAPAFLPRVLASLVPEGGDVTVHLEECDNDTAQDGLLNGTYDVILFVSEGARPSVHFDPLLEAPAYCLVPEGHPLADQPRVTMADIAREPLVVLNRPVAGAYYQSLFDAHTKGARVAAYASSTEMVRALVAEGQGCAVLNMKPLTDVTYSGGRVVTLPIADPVPPLTLAIGYDKSRPRRLVQQFVDTCRTHFATADADHCCIVAPGGD